MEVELLHQPEVLAVVAEVVAVEVPQALPLVLTEAVDVEDKEVLMVAVVAVQALWHQTVNTVLVPLLEPMAELEELGG